MELLSRDRTICGRLFAAQRVRNRRLSKPNTVVIRRAGYGALGRLDRVRGVRFLRLTRHAAGGPAQPEMTRSGSPDPIRLPIAGLRPTIEGWEASRLSPFPFRRRLTGAFLPKLNRAPGPRRTTARRDQRRGAP